MDTNYAGILFGILSTSTTSWQKESSKGGSFAFCGRLISLPFYPCGTRGVFVYNVMSLSISLPHTSQPSVF